MLGGEEGWIDVNQKFSGSKFVSITKVNPCEYELVLEDINGNRHTIGLTAKLHVDISKIGSFLSLILRKT